jgi:hypothetical protein
MVLGNPLAREDGDRLGPLLELFLAVKTARPRNALLRKQVLFLEVEARQPLVAGSMTDGTRR